MSTPPTTSSLPVPSASSTSLFGQLRGSLTRLRHSFNTLGSSSPLPSAPLYAPTSVPILPSERHVAPPVFVPSVSLAVGALPPSSLSAVDEPNFPSAVLTPVLDASPQRF